MRVEIERSACGRAGVLAALLACAPATWVSEAAAQAFPTKPVRIFTIQAAGSSIDTIARTLAQELGNMWGQPVLVENRLGAGGLIAADAVVKAPPDGHTLLLSAAGTLCLTPHLFPKDKQTFDAARDFHPVAHLANFGYGLVVSSELPVRSVEELIQKAKSGPGGFNWASPGAGSLSSVIGTVFANYAKINAQEIPYKSTPMALQDIATTRVQMMFDTLGTALPLIKGGKLRVLAVTDSRRDPVYPDVPTMEELGFKPFVFTNWFALYTGAGAPMGLVERISADIVKANETRLMLDRVTAMSMNRVSMDSKQFGAFYRAEYEKMGRLVKEYNIRMDP